MSRISKIELLREYLVFFVASTLLLYAVKLLQQFVVMPLESRIFDPEVVFIASVIFIPHGVKVLLMLFAGARALPVIFLAQYMGGVTLYEEWFRPLISSSLACVAMYLPLLILRTLPWKSWLFGIDDQNLFQKMILVALLSSVLNSGLMSIFHGNSLHDAISFRFLTGDLMGTLVVFTLFVLCRRTIYRFTLSKLKQLQRDYEL